MTGPNANPEARRLISLAIFTEMAERPEAAELELAFLYK